MSLDHSRKLIEEIAGRKEADEYVSGLLKDPDMRACLLYTSDAADE